MAKGKVDISVQRIVHSRSFNELWPGKTNFAAQGCVHQITGGEVNERLVTGIKKKTQQFQNRKKKLYMFAQVLFSLPAYELNILENT